MLLALPSFLFVAAFLVYPVYNLVRLSFYQYSPLRSTEQIYLGLENYRWMFTSDTVWSSLSVTLLFTLLSVALEVALALFVATLLSKLMLDARSAAARFFSKVANSTFILPFAAPAITAAVAWKLLLHPQFSPINAMLGKEIAWFTQFPLLSITLADAWKMTPLVLFLLLAAIMSIEPDQFEAAQIDGANAVQEFWYLTLPSILPVLVVTTAFRAVDAFTKIYDIVVTTTGGGPGNATEVFPLLIWKTAFSHMHFGQASALAVFAILISVGLSLALLWIQRRLRGAGQ